MPDIGKEAGTLLQRGVERVITVSPRAQANEPHAPESRWTPTHSVIRTLHKQAWKSVRLQANVSLHSSRPPRTLPDGCVIVVMGGHGWRVTYLCRAHRTRARQGVAGTPGSQQKEEPTAGPSCGSSDLATTHGSTVNGMLSVPRHTKEHSRQRRRWAWARARGARPSSIQRTQSAVSRNATAHEGHGAACASGTSSSPSHVLGALEASWQKPGNGTRLRIPFQTHAYEPPSPPDAEMKGLLREYAVPGRMPMRESCLVIVMGAGSGTGERGAALSVDSF